MIVLFKAVTNWLLFVLNPDTFLFKFQYMELYAFIWMG